MDLTAGTVVAERFRLERKLGEGGMGAVWLAHHVKLDMPCAVKFIHAEVESSAGIQERFEREAKIAAQIKSPHVVQVLDYGVSDGIPYMAMEYLDGEDLAQRLKVRERLLPEEAFPIVTQIARALTKAHAAGLVHRDLKPENVFLVRDDDHEIVKVLDFGIAKMKNPLADSKTRTGTLMGTPCYMSPEQAQGMKTLDHRSDLWALGVIAYRCVVGVLPFDSDAIGDLMMRIIVHALPVPSEVLPGLPPAFDAWWTRAAARDPAERFQTARELAEALGEAFGIAPATSNVLLSTSGGDARASITREVSSIRAATPPPRSSPLTPALALGRDAAAMQEAATMLPQRMSAVSSGSLAQGTPVTGYTMKAATPSSAEVQAAPRKMPVALLAVGAFALVVISAVVFFFLLDPGGSVPLAGGERVTSVASSAPSVPDSAGPPVASSEPEPAPVATPTPEPPAPQPTATPAPHPPPATAARHPPVQTKPRTPVLPPPQHRPATPAKKPKPKR